MSEHIRGGMIPSGEVVATDREYVSEWRRFHKAVCAEIKDAGEGVWVVYAFDPGLCLMDTHGRDRHIDLWAARVIAKNAGWKPKASRKKS